MKSLHLLLATLVLAATSGLLLTAINVVQLRSPALRVTMVLGGSGRYWQRLASGAKTAARELDVQLIIEQPATDSDVAEQSALLTQAASSAPDAVAVCALQPESQRSLIAKLARKSKTVTFVTEVPESPAHCHVGVSHYREGQRAADVAAEALPAGEKIILLKSAGMDIVESDRVRGFRDELSLWKTIPRTAGQPVWQILEATADLHDAQGANEATRAALAAHPDAACLVLMGEGGDVPPPTLFQTRHGSRSVKVIVFGETPEILDAIVAGRIDAAIGVDPYDAGYMSVEWAARLTRLGDLALPNHGWGRASVPVRVIRFDNVRQFRAQLQTIDASS